MKQVLASSVIKTGLATLLKKKVFLLKFSYSVSQTTSLLSIMGIQCMAFIRKGNPDKGPKLGEWDFRGMILLIKF